MKEKTEANPLDYQIDCLIAESIVNDGVMEESKAFLIKNREKKSSQVSWLLNKSEVIEV